MPSITINFTPAEFKAMLREAVNVELQLLQNRFAKKSEPSIYSRKEVAAMCKVHITTLHDWNLNGTLKAYKTGGRVYYKAEDVYKLLGQI